ncbi:MAG: sigma 54-interacting transcriptional regulator [Deltaproteobacteria bacterium]|nr:sigma 54-interacting transcriptional regulator [Deltaproteobacteria bacterium]
MRSPTPPRRARPAPGDILRRPSRLALRSFHGLYTVAPEMDRLFVALRRAARAESTVLLGGETGTGKELAARAIHAESGRRGASFRAVNCATLSPTLLESELFGHVRGAFTGAVRDRPGLFALAHGGTLLLDEVAEIPLDLQGKLLRVIQEKTFVPVGGSRSVTVDVRLIAATNKPLHAEVTAGRFRADLSYRLRVVPIHLPPLRRRRGDIEALFWHLVGEMNRRGLRRIEAVSRAALDALRAHAWPGNVRELYSAVEYAYVLGEGPLFDVDDLTPELRGEDLATGADQPPATERARLLAALAQHGGRKGAAAAALGMSRSTFWRKLSMLGNR